MYTSYREGDRSSGVAIKRSSTAVINITDFTCLSIYIATSEDESSSEECTPQVKGDEQKGISNYDDHSLWYS